MRTLESAQSSAPQSRQLKPRIEAVHDEAIRATLLQTFASLADQISIYNSRGGRGISSAHRRETETTIRAKLAALETQIAAAESRNMSSEPQ